MTILWEEETSRQMLEKTLPVSDRVDWAMKFCTSADKVCKLLESKEFELEEDEEQA